MKQRITIDQFNQLTKENKEKLRKWWIPENGDYVYFENYQKPDHEYLLVLTSPIIDINLEPRCDSQRREAIQVHWHTVDEFTYGTVFRDYEQIKDIYPLLSIGKMIEFLGSKCYSKRKELINQDLCDSLWEIVKEKLYE